MQRSSRHSATQSTSRRSPLGRWVLQAALLFSLVQSADAGTLQLFYGGVFHTGQLDAGSSSSSAGEGELGASSVVEALLVLDGRIVDLGDYAGVSASKAAQGAEQVDLGGAHVFPGLQDAHTSMERYGASLEEVDLLGAKGAEEIVARVREAASAVPEGAWVVGFGWDDSQWGTPAGPTHEALSAAVPRHPVWLVRRDRDGGLANQAAMVAAGLVSATTDGEPELESKEALSGLFMGPDQRKIAGAIPAPSSEERERHLLRAHDSLITFGITCAHDMELDGKAIELIAKLRKSGRWKLRVAAYIPLSEKLDGATLEALRKISGDSDGLRIVGRSIPLDGSFASRTATLLGDYSDVARDPLGNTAKGGPLRIKVGPLSNAIEENARLGLQPAILAHGDRATRAALDALEAVASRASGLASLRPRLEHAALLMEADFDRLKTLGIVLSVQPGLALDEAGVLNARLGDARAHRAYGWYGAVQPGLRQLVISLGSALPNGNADPLRTLRTALGRPGWEIRTALAGYTAGAAAAVFQEDRRGRIALGYLCDLTAFSTDLTGRERPRGGDGADGPAVIATVIDGEIVYRRPK